MTKVVAAFVILVGVMVLFVIYFSFSKTIITIQLKPQHVTASEAFRVSEVPDASSPSSIAGQILRVQLAQQKTYQGDIASSEIVDAKAHGTATIINQYSSAQPLVATTRLLSDDGVLFRTKESVRVPAGGRVEVEVEADEPGKAGEIDASRFTIVALWPGLQSKIYGESSKPMIEGTLQKRIITAETLQQAKEQLIAETYQQALNQLSHEIEVNHPNQTLVSEATKREVLNETASVEAQTEASSFEVSVEVAATTVLFDVPTVRDRLNQTLKENLPDHLELVDLETTQLAYEMSDVNVQSKTASLKVTATGSGLPKLSAPMFDRQPITNLDKQSIRAYFLEFDEVENVDVKFQPFWVVRSPTLIDHIEIQLQ